MTNDAADETAKGTGGGMPLYEATDLTKGGGVAQIRLADQYYTLRITRSGKLILTK